MDITPYDADIVTRTVLGEAGDQGPDGQAAIAHVILNRAASGQYGDASLANIALAPGQFQAWADNPRKLLNIATDSKQYQAASDVVHRVIAGSIPDPTGGALNYYNPTLQARNGAPPPAFASTPMLAQVGAHQFFNPVGAASASNGLSADDLAETARLAGLPSPTARGYAPVSSGGGVTVMLPTGGNAAPSAAPTIQPSAPAAAISDADMQETARIFGLGATPKAPLPQNFAAADLPSQAPPEIRAAAAKVPVGFPQAVASSMPIVGPAFDAATAAAEAAIQPFTDPKAAATFAGRYMRNRLVQDEAMNQWQAAHHLASVAAALTGGAMVLGPLGETTAGAALLGLPNASRIGATIGGRVYSGAAGGAAIGATDAALRGDNPVTGAEVGAAGGAAGPLIGESVGTATTAASNILRRPANALADVNAIGRGWLANAMANETNASLAAALDRMGPNGFLADVNPNLTELAAGVANRPEPPASAAVGEAYRQRQAQQPAVIGQALNNAFGNKVDIEQFGQMIAENRAAAADPLYAQFRSMRVTPTPELKALIPRLEHVGAFEEAKYLGAAKDIDINEKFFTPGSNKAFPTTATWDLVKRGVDSKIEQALSSGNKTRAAALIGLKQELISEIGQTPAGQVWNQARSEFADRSELLDQLAAGRDTFLGSRSGLSVDELRQELKGLSGPELAARIIGARSAADDVMGAARNGDTQLRNKFLAPNNQEKLRLLIGNDRANALIKTLEQQEYLSSQAKYVNPRAGSPTAPRTQAVNALEPPPVAPWNVNITQPLSFIPPRAIEALRPSNIMQGGREQAYATARQQIVPALLAHGTALADLIAAISQESAARSAAVRRGSVVSRGVTAAITGPGSTAARLKGNFRANALAPTPAQ